MTTSPRFNVLSTGKIISGFDPETVQGHLLTRLRLKPEHAAQFFSRPRVLKKDLTRAEADKFCKGLAALGIEVKAAPIDPPTPKPTPQRLTDTVGFEPEQEIPPLHATEESLSLVEDDTPSRTSRDTIECPNCGHVQEKSEQCTSCGIFFHKWDSTATQTTGRHPTQTATGLRAPASVAASKPAATSRQQKQERGFNVVALVAATLAALAGAWAWKFVAITFDYELALVAWAIGGAVGFAAAMFGSQGTPAGVVCALLVVGSIALGKYWAFDAILDQFRDISTEMASDDAELRAVYEEQREDANLFVQLDGSDGALRQYMVERNYTDATQASRVSRQELRDFREYFEQDLRDFAARQPSFREWQTGQDFSLSEVSAWEMVRESLGIIDLLFLFLGVGTAFRLASQMD